MELTKLSRSLSGREWSRKGREEGKALKGKKEREERKQ